MLGFKTGSKFKDGKAELKHIEVETNYWFFKTYVEGFAQTSLQTDPTKEMLMNKENRNSVLHWPKTKQGR